MKAKRDFDIDIYKLSNQKHDYEYDINSSFFEGFENSLIEKGSLRVKLTLDKSETFIQSYFHMQGTVELTCDRSLEKYEFPIDQENKLIFKYAEEFSEISDEIMTIPKDLQQLNMAQYIYEFIGLAIPMKKLHPRFVTEDDQEDAETILIYTTEAEKPEEETKEEIDPRWEILNKLKKNNN
ncbi:MAG: YceD family protein [Cytophagaceae bacterium]